MEIVLCYCVYNYVRISVESFGKSGHISAACNSYEYSYVKVTGYLIYVAS